MTLKKDLENFIRGWFPTTPNLPKPQNNNLPKLQNTNLGVLNHDFLQLKLFFGFFTGGVTMFTSGIFSWRKKK